jgi:hypothetical protein
MQAPNAASCHNCGAPLYGRFCATCGQEDRPLDPGVREVVDEVARELTSLDSRVLASIRRLFLSPGFLTTEYTAGRRARWVSPVRLYLIFSVAYFGLAALADRTPISFNLRATGGTPDDARQAAQALGFATEEDLQRAVGEALRAWTPRAMFVLVPLFAWFVSGVRRRAQRNYPQHLIFSLHVFAAFFGVQALATGAGHLAGSPWVSAVLSAGTVLYYVAYAAIALRAVYGGTFGRALGAAVIVLVLYWLATIVTAAAIVVPVLFWR